MGAQVPTEEMEEKMEGPEVGEDENQENKGHVMLAVHSLEKPGGPKPPAKKASPLEYLKSRQR